jgi:hypothetical protein
VEPGAQALTQWPCDGLVYRHFDAVGELLYIGKTTAGVLRDRHLSHALRARWWRFVTQVRCERYGDQRGVSLAEAEAIQTEAPIFNRTLKGRGQEAREQEYLRRHAHVQDRWIGVAVRVRPHLGPVEKGEAANAMLRELGIFDVIAEPVIRGNRAKVRR